MKTKKCTHVVGWSGEMGGLQNGQESAAEEGLLEADCKERVAEVGVDERWAGGSEGALDEEQGEEDYETRHGQLHLVHTPALL